MNAATAFNIAFLAFLGWVLWLLLRPTPPAVDQRELRKLVDEIRQLRDDIRNDREHQ